MVTLETRIDRFFPKKSLISLPKLVKMHLPFIGWVLFYGKFYFAGKQAWTYFIVSLAALLINKKMAGNPLIWIYNRFCGCLSSCQTKPAQRAFFAG